MQCDLENINYECASNLYTSLRQNIIVGNGAEGIVLLFIVHTKASLGDDIHSIGTFVRLESAVAN